MKESYGVKRSAFVTLFILVAALASPDLVKALTITDLGTTAPIPGTDDQSYLPTGGVSGSTVYSNSPANGTLSYGETFTTGNDASSYTLSYVIMELAFNYSEANNTLNIPMTIDLAGTPVVAAETVTPLVETALGTQGGVNNHFLEFAFANPITLSANTQYSFALGPQNGGGANTWAGTTADGYAGGAVFSNNTDNGGPGEADFVFDVGLTPVAAVPEPGTASAMLLAGAGFLLFGRHNLRRNLRRNG